MKKNEKVHIIELYMFTRTVKTAYPECSNHDHIVKFIYDVIQQYCINYDYSFDSLMDSLTEFSDGIENGNKNFDEYSNLF